MALKHQLSLKRGGRVEAVAAAIAWQLLDESSHTTGAFIEVSGGTVAQIIYPQNLTKVFDGR